MRLSRVLYARRHAEQISYSQNKRRANRLPSAHTQYNKYYYYTAGERFYYRFLGVTITIIRYYFFYFFYLHLCYGYLLTCLLYTHANKCLVNRKYIARQHTRIMINSLACNDRCTYNISHVQNNIII